MKFLFTCGGTAGHINPAIAVAGRLQELLPDAEILFAGAEGNMECDLVPRAGYPIETIKITNLQRKPTPKNVIHNIKTLRYLAASKGAAAKLIRDFRPDAAIGTGGYVCYPVLKAAAKAGVPTLVHESNVVPGLTTRMLERSVSKVMVGFEAGRKEYKDPEKVAFTGTPVRGEFFALTRKEARRKLGMEEETPFVLSFWGSLGASGMNSVMESFIVQNVQQKAFRHLHASGGGEAGCQAMLSRLAEKGAKDLAAGGTSVRPYIFDMPLQMAAADLILCRAGASTISELTALGKPVILVPSPYVTNNHQEQNARVLEKGGGARLIRESDCTGAELFQMTKALLEKRESLSQMAAAMKKLGVPDATDQICSTILGFINF